MVEVGQQVNIYTPQRKYINYLVSAVNDATIGLVPYTNQTDSVIIRKENILGIEHYDKGKRSN